MKKLCLNYNFNYIQQIRLAQALSESQFELVIATHHLDKFTLLKDKFGMEFTSSCNNAIDITKFIELSHSEPITSIGGLYRPLLFPHAIVNYCRRLWNVKREHKFSFAGLIQSSRKKLIEDWIKQNLSKNIILPNVNSFFLRVNRYLSKLFFGNFCYKRRIGDLFLWSSDRGRVFPIKSWDNNYFELLANTEFTLCPAGDFIWTYRFFEAILCGSIPVIEKDCSAYSGFRYFYLNENIKNMKWSKELADFNYALCKNRITVPEDDLNNELKNITKIA